MKSVVLALALLCGIAAAGTNWAILVAGSNQWYNYRHQSDIYHAYQILKSHGFPDSNIVVMHYDDIANNAQSPRKGVVINRPNGPNNYPGVPKDYTGSQTTAANFFNVLMGREEAVRGVGSGKVIKPTSDDRVFIYYSDHGATGLVAMPVGPYLYAKDLISSIKTLYSQQRYKEFVIYIEACESGSMLSDLPTNIKAFGTTASNPTESSYAWYYDSTFRTYLGDEYSVRWMENSDDNAGAFDTVTLGQQFQNLTKTVTMSHPMAWGDQSLSARTLDFFQAFEKHAKEAPITHTRRNPADHGVDSRDVVIDVLTRRYVAATPAEKPAIEQELRAEVASREFHDKTVMTILTTVAGANAATDLWNGRFRLTQHECQKTVVENYRETCGFTDYSLKHVQKLVNMCEAGYETATIVEAVTKHCA